MPGPSHPASRLPRRNRKAGATVVVESGAGCDRLMASGRDSPGWVTSVAHYQRGVWSGVGQSRTRVRFGSVSNFFRPKPVHYLDSWIGGRQASASTCSSTRIVSHTSSVHWLFPAKPEQDASPGLATVRQVGLEGRDIKARRTMPDSTVWFGRRLVTVLRERSSPEPGSARRRAGLGVTTLKALEHDLRQRPHPQTLVLLAEALGLSAAEQASLLDAANGASSRRSDAAHRGPEQGPTSPAKLVRPPLPASPR